MFEQIAQDALNDLIENGVKVPFDRKGDAISYAEDSYAALRVISTYEPAADATFLSKKAAIEYVKAKISGRDPLSAQNFLTAAQAWTRAAAIEKSRQREKDWLEDSRFSD